MSNQKLITPKLTSTLLAERIMVLFKDHVGHNKGIERNELFKYLYGEKYKKTISVNNVTIRNYEHLYKADLMRKALHHLRVFSTCFVTSLRNDSGETEYAVVSNAEEAELYCGRLSKNIKRLNEMKKRARQSVREGWYKKPFLLR